MTGTVIFGGTTEGRELAEYCAANGISALVSVVSEYGERLLPRKSPSLEIRQGAMDEEEMESLLASEQPAFVLDATHPYAAAVSESLVRACRKQNMEYLRVIRGHAGDGHGDEIVVSNAGEAAEILLRDRRPVFVTTGSKELASFTALPDFEERIYARVLPDSRVIAMCEKLGIPPNHLIAMQGPFSEELNRAMFAQTGAGWVVTKESGNRGGFEEKIAAARACGASVIVIGRPTQEEGITVSQAKERLAALDRTGVRRLALIGAGMGGALQLTGEAAQALADSQAVFGAPRLLADVSDDTKKKTVVEIYQAEAVLDWLGAHPDILSAAVLFSGDTGFYSGCGPLLEKLEKRSAEEPWETVVYPGISTVSCLCARLKTSWEDVCLGSIHGRSADVPELVARHRRVFLLLGGGDPVAGLARTLTEAGYGDALIFVGERLGYPDEQIYSGTASGLQGHRSGSLAAVLIERNEEQ